MDDNELMEEALATLLLIYEHPSDPFKEMYTDHLRKRTANIIRRLRARRDGKSDATNHPKNTLRLR